MIKLDLSLECKNDLNTQINQYDKPQEQIEG